MTLPQPNMPVKRPNHGCAVLPAVASAVTIARLFGPGFAPTCWHLSRACAGLVQYCMPFTTAIVSAVGTPQLHIATSPAPSSAACCICPLSLVSLVATVASAVSAPPHSAPGTAPTCWPLSRACIELVCCLPSHATQGSPVATDALLLNPAICCAAFEHVLQWLLSSQLSSVWPLAPPLRVGL
jgi:hypothetical protein